MVLLCVGGYGPHAEGVQSSLGLSLHLYAWLLWTVCYQRFPNGVPRHPGELGDESRDSGTTVDFCYNAQLHRKSWMNYLTLCVLRTRFLYKNMPQVLICRVDQILVRSQWQPETICKRWSNATERPPHCCHNNATMGGKYREDTEGHFSRKNHVGAHQCVTVNIQAQ